MGASRSGLQRLGLVVGVLALGALRCTYAPNPPSGQLQCSSGGACPEGYDCAINNYCYKRSDGQSGQAGATGQAGVTGAAGMGAAGMGAAGMGAAGMGAAGTGVKTPCAGSCTIKIQGSLTNSTTMGMETKFVGKWLFNGGSTEIVTCTDGSSRTTDLSATMDYVDMAVANGVLKANYFCSWDLNVPVATPNTTMMRVGQSCSRDVPDPKTGTTKFTWHGTTFTFRTDDGKTSTLASTIAVDYVDDASKTGCTP